MTITYYVDNDPDDPDFFSVFMDNGKGCSAEIAGKISEAKTAILIAAMLTEKQQ